MPFSPDTLALNPDLAKQLKKRKAKTVSGKGHGHSDDAQVMAAAGKYTYPPAREMLKTATEQYIWLLERFGTKSGLKQEDIAELLAALRHLMNEQIIE